MVALPPLLVAFSYVTGTQTSEQRKAKGRTANGTTVITVTISVQTRQEGQQRSEANNENHDVKCDAIRSNQEMTVLWLSGRRRENAE